MKRKLFLTVSFFILFPILSIAQSSLEDLKQTIKRWDYMFNAGQVEQLLTLYADDVVSMPYNAPTRQGKDALRVNFKKMMEGNIVHHETQVEEILNTSDWAVERANYTLTIRPRDGGKEKVETGRHVVCRKRKDGRWLITWEIWNTDTPAK